MSRQTFASIVKNEAELMRDAPAAVDAKGYTLEEWFDDGVVGWDEPLRSYFLQCFEEEDGPVWWLGTDYEEIPSFEALCAVIRRSFGNQINFVFVDTIGREC